MKKLLKKLIEAGISPADITPIIHPCGVELCDLLTENDNSFKTLEKVIKDNYLSADQTDDVEYLLEKLENHYRLC